MSACVNVLNIIKEGKASVKLPATVFYNPVQEFNRDMSVLILRAYLKNNLWHYKKQDKQIQARGGIRILDALSASGLRSIRYAKELTSCKEVIKEIVANDLSASAADLIKTNIELNGVQDLVKCSHSDAINLLHSSALNNEDKFHVMDLDPFGTGVQFFDAALRNIGEAGLLMVTCTDTAVLCGNASESCYARYGGMSLRNEFCHDAALRILLKSLQAHASVYGRIIKPLISVSVDFYVRVFLQVYSKPAETKRTASQFSQIFMCKNCKNHELNPLGTMILKENEKQAQSGNLAVQYKFRPADASIDGNCRICGGTYVLGGPIWNGPIHDKSFLELIKKELELEDAEKEFGTYRRLLGMIHVCSEELEVPLMYSIDQMASILKMQVPKRQVIKSALLNAGFKTSSTHTNSTGLKTDAPSHVIWDIFCQLAEDQEPPQKTSPNAMELRRTILKRFVESGRKYDMSLNRAALPESQRMELLRFQINPTRNWGPKSRPAKAVDV